MAQQAIAINTLPFWSRFTQTLDLRYDGANVLREHFNPGFTIPCFDYRKGEQNVAALEGSRSTARDTILVQANQTRGGGLYRIYGVSFTKDGWAYERGNVGGQPGIRHTLYPPSGSQAANGAAGPQVPSVEDWRALDSLFCEVFLKYFRFVIEIDGTRRILEMGPAMLYPGVNGPTGGNVDTVNGAPFVSNYMKIKEGIVWNPAGTVDSNLTVKLQAEYLCETPTWTTPAGTADGEPVSQDNPAIADANPTALGRVWTQGWICNLHGVEEAPVSNVS